MHTRALFSWLLTAAALAFVAPPATAASGCTTSANQMRTSCIHEMREELFETFANCNHLAPADSRRECYRDARMGREEVVEECAAQHEARLDVCELLDENRYFDPLVDPSIDFIDPDDIPAVYANNPYVKLQAGHTHVLRSEDETVVVHATDESREIQGVLCRVVVDIVVEEEFNDDENEWEYTPVEVTDDWFAQSMNRDVYYCGEVSRDFEDGVLRDIGGSFESGIDYAKAGALTLAMPAVNQAHRQEYALGEAEDVVQYLAIATTPTDEEGGDNPNFPCADTCLKTFDFTPLEPDSSEYKFYLPNIGFVLGLGLEDDELTGDREELVCHGESLDILQDPGCAIGDAVELLDELCELHEAFCPDDD